MQLTSSIDLGYPVFERTILPNGLRVVTEQIPSVRSISVGVWIGAGSRDEAPEEAGLAHFIEHMVFKGTTRRRGHHIAQRMEAVGGYLNAFTSKEYTCYYARALDEHLGRALDVVLDLALDPVFPEKEIEKEQDVVLEEIKMYADAPEDLIFDHYEATIYPDHPLGWPVLGTPETVRSFTRDNLRAFVETRYTPNRLVVSVAGNVEHGAVVALVRKLTAGFDRALVPVDRAPVNGYAPRRVVETRPIQQAHLVVGTRAWGLQDERRTAVSILNTILGGGMSSRLSQNIREKYGYCYSVYSFANMLADAGDFGVYIGVDAGKVDRARHLVERELDKLATRRVSDRMLNRAKTQLKGSMMLGLESMSNRMMRMGKVELAFERYFTLDDVIAHVDAVTADDVRDVAAALFRQDRLSSIAIVPEKGA
ncbi:MAG: pitrilysin family protein [Bacteroidota bacterium]